MYQTIEEFINDWKFESGLTLTIFKSLTDESLFAAVPGYRRTVSRLAWHITGSAGEMLKAAGTHIPAFEERDKEPNTAAKIVEEYEKASANLIDALQNNWTDASLKEEVNMFGEMWTKAFSLQTIIRHQIHHRGQLMVLMRLNGLKVPGIYGPAYEDWKQFGMEPRL